MANRELTGIWAKAVTLICWAFALFHLYTGAAGTLPHMQQRSIHILFAFVLIFLTIKPSGKMAKGKGSVPWWELTLAFMSVVVCSNIFINYETYNILRGEAPGTNEVILGTFMLVLSLEAGRRMTGPVLPILAVLMIVYTFAGPYIEGFWRFPGTSYGTFISEMYKYDTGMWGILTGASASLVVMFMFLVAFLKLSGAQNTFLKIALLVGGRYRGGPGLAAVVSSALFGMIAGSGVANVVATGSFTIPMMKKVGYEKNLAGAIEAVASQGGQIMPPIMGSAAFVMAELLGIPYLKIMIVAIIPATLYFLTVGCAVRLSALRQGLPPAPPESIPQAREVVNWRSLAPIALPLGVLLYFLILGFSAYTAGFYSIIAGYIVYIFTDFSITGILQRVKNIPSSWEDGAKSTLMIAALCVIANMFTSMLFITGLGSKVVSLLIGIGGSNIIFCLIITAVAGILLGMGLPVVGAYILSAAILAPALVMLGLTILNVHFFVFYWAVLSLITPPVCPGAYAAAVIADGQWFKVAMNSCKLAILIFLLPFTFILQPAFLLQGTVLSISISIITGIIGVIATSAGIYGYLNRKLSVYVRLLFIPGGMLLFIPETLTDLIGFALLGSGLFVSIMQQLRTAGKLKEG